MGQCQICGKELDLPFKCNYCSGVFCSEHRLPENHGCSKAKSEPPPYINPPRFSKDRPRKIGTCPRCHHANSQMLNFNAETMIFKCGNCGIKYGQKKSYPYRYFRLRRRRQVTIAPVSPIEPREHRKPKLKKAAAAILTITIISAAMLFLYENPNTLNFQNLLPKAPSHDELVACALELINTDRQTQQLQNVSLSAESSGQQHADDMLNKNYFSHWDTNGYKPYVRYTLAGGKGAVAENIATESGSYSDPKTALKQMEYSMMFDDAGWNWGHRDNIMNAFHNKVSIGIAYDSSNICFVEDFEDDYVSWSTLTFSTQAAMQGTISKAGQTIMQVAIYFDKPTNLTTQQLENPPYDGAYDSGTYVGVVVSPPPSGQEYSQPTEGIMIIATTWGQTGQNFYIRFDLSSAFAKYGQGIYTLLLFTETNSYLTTLSVWNQ